LIGLEDAQAFINSDDLFFDANRFDNNLFDVIFWFASFQGALPLVSVF
jgi:hypothetical protein